MMEVDISSDEDSPTGQVLFVESDNDDLDLDVPPATGNEYLRRVRMEASTCPRVVVADIDTKSFRGKQTVHVKHWVGECQPAPCGYAPSLSWQLAQVANFAEQRQKLARCKAKRLSFKVDKFPKVPRANDVDAWCRLCFGRVRPPRRQGQPPPEELQELETGVTSPEAKAVPSASDFPAHEGILPLVSVMLAMDQPTVIKVLEYHLNWFEATGFTEKQGYWFYALLICLDKPLPPDACSLLRSLARACARLRASLEGPEDFKLVPLNLFICLISRYFDQSDLKDDVT